MASETMYSRHLARSVFRRRRASLEVKFLIVTILLSFGELALAQSGRVAAPDPTGAATPERPVKELFNEANAYFRTKGAEFDAKKIAATPVADPAGTQRDASSPPDMPLRPRAAGTSRPRTVTTSGCSTGSLSISTGRSMS